MNANDSSSLIDSPLAGRLGENRALLYRGDSGTLEKFRPFSAPPSDWLKRIGSPIAPASRLDAVPAPPGPQSVQPEPVNIPEPAPAETASTATNVQQPPAPAEPVAITPPPITPSPITPSPITPPAITPPAITPPAITPPAAAVESHDDELSDDLPSIDDLIVL